MMCSTGRPDSVEAGALANISEVVPSNRTRYSMIAPGTLLATSSRRLRRASDSASSARRACVRRASHAAAARAINAITPSALASIASMRGHEGVDGIGQFGDADGGVVDERSNECGRGTDRGGVFEGVQQIG